MNTRMIVAAVVTVISAVSTIAHAEPKATKTEKPVVCTSFEIVPNGKAGMLAANYALCTDKVKPVILREYSIVELPDPTAEGRPMKVVVGWR